MKPIMITRWLNNFGFVWAIFMLALVIGSVVGYVPTTGWYWIVAYAAMAFYFFSIFYFQRTAEKSNLNDTPKNH